MKGPHTKISILLAVFSGVVTALAFPARFGSLMFPNLGFLAWFSFVPLFTAVYCAPPRKTFILTFISGIIFYSISLFWLYNALTEYGKISPAVAVAVLALMMIILGTYLGVITWLAKSIISRFNVPWLALLPVVWVTVELIRNYFPFGGFPWNNIAYSQAGYPLLIQSADAFGIYGVTFLIVLVNGLIAELVIKIREFDRRQVVRNAATVLLLFAAAVTYGWYCLITDEPRSPANKAVRTALIQGSIPQDEKWEKERLEENLKIYADYTKLLGEGEVDLIVWPESAYPYVIPLDIDRLDPVKFGMSPEKARPYRLLFGALSINRTSPDKHMYNSALLIDNSGAVEGRYHKVHLVPFGEYVPLRRVLFFAKKLVAPIGDFRPGDGYAPMPVGGMFMIAPLICYEDVFPEIARAFVRSGANILVNITNDAWYGWTSAAHQHLAISVFRAVENRRYMVRAANTGVTAVIDSKGRVEIESGLFSRSFTMANVPVLNKQTVYNKIGDTFAYICAMVTIFLTAASLGKAIYEKIRKDS